MIDKKSFSELRNQMESFDTMREELIAHSRIVLKSSKAAIYAGHRGDAKGAKKLLEEAKSAITKARNLIKKDECLATTGAFTDSLEEYAEAELYTSYLEKRKLPTAKQIGVDAHTYLPAVSDLIGELVRKAINSSINGDHQTAMQIKEDVDEMYAELMLFDWRSTARRKFDAIKYGLEKLEDLALKIKFKS